MACLKSPKNYPVFVVVIAAISMFIVIESGNAIDKTFPLLLFLTAKLCLLFGAVEIGLSAIGKYKDQQEIFNSISRAITAFGMAACFVLLITAYEASKRMS